MLRYVLAFFGALGGVTIANLVLGTGWSENDTHAMLGVVMGLLNYAILSSGD